MGSSVAGFTVLEMLAVLAVLGVLMAIAAPSWLTFLQVRSLDTAQDKVFQDMRLAQAEAKRTSVMWQVSIRDAAPPVELAVHRVGTRASQVRWHSLNTNIRLDVAETTVQRDRTEGVYQVQFNSRGRVNGALGKITLTTGQGRNRRCVIVSTLLGVLRKAADRACL